MIYLECSDIKSTLVYQYDIHEHINHILLILKKWHVHVGIISPYIHEISTQKKKDHLVLSITPKILPKFSN